MKIKNDDIYITSPMIFFKFFDKEKPISNLSNFNNYEEIDKKIIEIMFYCLSSKTIGKIKDKFQDNLLIKICIDEKIILSIKNENFINQNIWEKNNWSRAAYLLFSQINLQYYDDLILKNKQKDFILKRRELMKTYLKESDYPKRNNYKGDIIKLPKKREIDIDLNIIRDRKSNRNFSTKKVDFNVLSDLLYYSTQEIRSKKDEENLTDNVFILNSFYSWADIFVYIQGVKKLNRGLYYYDVNKHSLVLINDKIDDNLISKTIQGQNWFRGSGFCLFFGVNWDRYKWIYRHSRAYLNLLIQIGEFSQEFLYYGYNLGLTSWMTPAVSETYTNELFELKNKKTDIVFFMKFGIKKQNRQG